MGQQKRPRRLDMAGLQVFWYFCLLGNWPNRYEIGVIKKFIHFFFCLVCLVTFCFWVCLRFMRTLTSMAGQWD